MAMTDAQLRLRVREHMAAGELSFPSLSLILTIPAQVRNRYRAIH
jgi:hypothetical protein